MPSTMTSPPVDRVLTNPYWNLLRERMEPTHRYTLGQLYSLLRIRSTPEKENFKRLLADKLQTGEITHKNLRYEIATVVTGKVDHVSAQYAYIITSHIGDVWVQKHNLGHALHNDTVRVTITQQERAGKKAVGKVIEIVERSSTLVVGRLEKKKGGDFVVPDGRRMHHAIHVPFYRGARDGDKVAVQIKDWPTRKKFPQGEIVEIFGRSGEHAVEMHAIMVEFGLPAEFTNVTLAAADAIPAGISLETSYQRRDYRKIPTITIDPEDAKDFDDALSFRVLASGKYEIGVHIADVSHYVQEVRAARAKGFLRVQEGGSLDQEELNRGTSVYLVDRTVPMLPERLSNELCSLKPDEDRLAFSIIWEMNQQGDIQKEWIGETIIHSNKRFSYEEAQKVMDSQQGAFYEELNRINVLAKRLRQQRFLQGAIDLDTTEVKFQLDDDGKPLGVMPKERRDTHRLVEEWMLLANRRIANWVQKKRKVLPFIYLLHDTPNPEKLEDFFCFVRHLGYGDKLRGKSTAEDLNTVSKALVGHPMANIVQVLAIRTMAKAIYTTQAQSHFGLAFAHYTHFTSPIRRYPDLVVHRLLKQYLKKEQGGREPQDYEKICLHASAREKVAADAERASIAYKQVELMLTLEGQELPGVISSITEWGFYVELVANKLEGMVAIADIKNDYYVLDKKNFRIFGQRSQNVYQLGDTINVRVKSCNLSRRTVDLLPV